MIDLPLVSVIIPTHNSSAFLEDCLRSIKDQTFHNIEMIVVDNYSADATKEISLKYEERFFEKGPERTAQRNFGFEQSNGDYVVFIDSDMTLTDKVVDECVREARKSEAIIIPEVSIGEEFWTRCIIFERSLYIDDVIITSARFFTRKAFEAVGGYDEELVGTCEDKDLTERVRLAGFKFGCVNARIIHNEGHISPSSIFKKWRYAGLNIHKYFQKNPAAVKIQFNPFRPAWFRNWRRLILHPVYTSGFLFLKLCQIAGLIVGQLDAIVRSVVDERR